MLQVENYHLYEVGYEETPIYTGLARHYQLRRLSPYTEYHLVLEACTGRELCTRSPPNKFRTAEASPEAQSPPQVVFANATAIMISWLKPLRANGRVIKYQVDRLKLPGNLLVSYFYHSCFYRFVLKLLPFPMQETFSKVTISITLSHTKIKHSLK